MLKPKQNMLKPIMNLKTMKYMNKIMYLAIYMRNSEILL